MRIFPIWLTLTEPDLTTKNTEWKFKSQAGACSAHGITRWRPPWRRGTSWRTDPARPWRSPPRWPRTWQSWPPWLSSSWLLKLFSIIKCWRSLTTFHIDHIWRLNASSAQFCGFLISGEIINSFSIALTTQLRLVLHWPEDIDLT